MIGEWVERRPDLVRQIRAAGHDVGNHTYTHADLPDLADAEVASELERTAATVERVLGDRPRLFRAPGFKKDGRVLEIVARMGLVDVGCDVNPEDWRNDLSAEEIARRVLANVGPRSIVDLHDGFPPYWPLARRDCTPTVLALERLVPELQRRGYRLVSLTELLASVAPID